MSVGWLATHPRTISSTRGSPTRLIIAAISERL
jgi:hypothetical protein